MTVTIDSLSNGYQGYGGSLTYAHTVSGTNAYLVVMGSAASFSDKVSGVTYNGQAMTRLYTDALGTSGQIVYIYGIPLGTGDGVAHNVVWTYTSGDVNMVAIGVSVNGVSQSSPIANHNFNTNGYMASGDSVAITTPAGSIALDYLTINDSTTTMSAGAGQTLILAQNGLNGIVSSYKANATAMVGNWTGGVQHSGTHSALSFTPASGGGTTNNPPTFTGAIANITGTSGTSITPVDVHSLFSDTDTLAYSASPAGTAWPSGLTINSSTGVISGTVASATTATGLKVRATDTASQTVDSNAFSVTISAPGATAITLSGPNSGQVSVASTNFTVGANGPITGTVVVTPSDSGAGGTFTPATVSISSASPTGTFTYTPSSTAGAKTISVTNNGSLTNPGSIVYTASATVSYVDFGTERCDHVNNGLLPSIGLSAVVWRRDDLNVSKQVIPGITTNSDGTVPRFAVTFPVGTPVHVALITTADNTAAGLVSDHSTVS